MEQEVDRSAYLGGPDMAAILGKHPYLSALQVYANKLGLSEPFTGNEFTWLGSALEPALRKWYREEILEGEFESSGEIFLRHPEHAFLGGHPDDILLSKGGELHHMLEIKVVVSRKVKATWGGMPFTDQIPAYHLIQVAYYLMLAELPYCDVVACFIGDSKMCYRVERSAALETLMVREAVRFWTEHVMLGCPPDVSALSVAAQAAALDQIYPHVLTVHAQATPEVEALARRWQEINAETKETATEKDQIQAAVKQFIGDGSGVEGTFGKIIWPEMPGAIRNSKVIETLAREYQIPVDEVKRVKEANRGRPFRKLTPYFSD